MIENPLYFLDLFPIIFFLDKQVYNVKLWWYI